MNELRKQTDDITAHNIPGISKPQLPKEDGVDLAHRDNSQAETGKEIQNVIVNFIRSIGISILEEVIEASTFLPGMKVSNGGLIIDRNKLLYPGDMLHEAGHIAVTPAIERPFLNDRLIEQSKNKEAEEMMAIAWSYAACIHLNIDPSIVFHEQGYKGAGSNIAENFSSGHYFGTPMLQWCGMTIEPKPGVPAQDCFPKMIKWLRV